MNPIAKLIVCAGLGTVLTASASVPAPAHRKSAAIAAWENLRFGAFVHYNMNTYGPRSPLDDYFGGDCRNADLFRPERLDVAQWVRGLKEAGVHYAVLTTRHIGGFLLWDSATSDYTSARSRFVMRDIVAEFVKECRRQGVTPAFYYLMGGSRGDTSSCALRGARFDRRAVVAQLTELATRYGEIPYFWIDMMDWRPEDLSTQEVYDLIRSYQPDAVIAFNQHTEEGTHIHYFPTDVINGEETLPVPGFRPEANALERRSSGNYYRRTDDNASYVPGRYYLPFEFSMTGQVSPDEAVTTPVGFFRNTLWFTRSVTHSERGRTLYLHARNAYERGAANFLLAAAPDESGSMRADDLEQLKILGNLIDGRASDTIEPGSSVVRVERLGRLANGARELRCRYEAADRPLEVRELGRFRALGNRGRHQLKLLDSRGRILAEAEVDLAKTTPDFNGYAFATLPKPVRLEAGARFELVSSETGDDSYYPEAVVRHDARARVVDCTGPLALAYDVPSKDAGDWDLGASRDGEVADLSGHGNTARVHRARSENGALRFDGGRDYVEVLNSGFLDLDGSLTLSARISPERTDGTRNILAHGYTRVPAREVFLRIRDGRYEAGAWSESGEASVSAPVPRADLGAWVDIEATYDGARWSLLRNGRLLASKAATRGAIRVPADWAIGGCTRGVCAGGETRGFAGRIARVRIGAKAVDKLQERF